MNNWATVSNATHNGTQVTRVDIFSSTGVHLTTRILPGWNADLTIVTRNWRVDTVHA